MSIKKIKIIIITVKLFPERLYPYTLPKHTLTSRKAYPQTNRIKMLYSSFDLHFFKY